MYNPISGFIVLGERRIANERSQVGPMSNQGLEPELLSNVVFLGRESGGVLQDSVGEDSSLDDEGELMASVEASPASFC